MRMQVIGVGMGVIVPHAMTVAVTVAVIVVVMPVRMVMGMLVMMVVMTVSHGPYSTSGPAGIETGLSMMDLCEPILPWETSVPSTSTITRVASSAVMSEVS